MFSLVTSFCDIVKCRSIFFLTASGNNPSNQTEKCSQYECPSPTDFAFTTNKITNSSTYRNQY